MLLTMQKSLLLAAGLLLSGAARAQWGVQLGGHGSTFATAPNMAVRRVTTEAGLGYQASVFYEHAFRPYLSLVPELRLSQQSTKLAVADYSRPGAEFAGDYRLRLIYLSLPVLLRATVGKYYLEAGPQAGYLVALHRTGTGEGAGPSGPQGAPPDASAPGSYQRFDLGAAGGVGVRLGQGLALSLRGYSGFRSLVPRHHPPLGYTGSLRSEQLQISLSYQLKRHD
ncbi:outer membrane protein with beta-barrel domain [Hymenobacter chitinivorans DSM 11115]|uniref:Outer membrane protein with beta-barrel domain n=2 Tax=Hymenobacter chitinivorans TaxID=89969 RepID=A0A2M9B5P9_9BACT|nr:outer membrane protein with beta-barrel domain [Hymenobacter chitinivorans DSM 11115]